MGSEEWSDPWARQTRTKYKKKKIGAVRAYMHVHVHMYMYGDPDDYYVLLLFDAYYVRAQ